MYYNVSKASVPDITSTVSAMYKRGLLTDQTVYNASGNKISAESSPLVTSYASLTSPVIKKSPGFKWGVYIFNVHAGGIIPVFYVYTSSYWVNVENYRLTQTSHSDYDQLTPANFIQKNTSFTYCPNNRHIRSQTTTDSKNHTHTQTYYHSDDTGVPLVTPAEQTALHAMAAANCTGALVHETDNKNNVIHEDHKTYTAFQLGTTTNVFPTAISSYVTASRNLIKQTTYNYDALSGNVLSTNELNGLVTSFLYKYNGSLVVAKAVNATNTATYTTQTVTQTGYINVPPSTWTAQTASFTSYAAGTITISFPPGSYLAGQGGVTCFLISLCQAR